MAERWGRLVLSALGRLIRLPGSAARFVWKRHQTYHYFLAAAGIVKPFGPEIRRHLVILTGFASLGLLAKVALIQGAACFLIILKTDA